MPEIIRFRATNRLGFRTSERANHTRLKILRGAYRADCVPSPPHTLSPHPLGMQAARNYCATDARSRKPAAVSGTPTRTARSQLQPSAVPAGSRAAAKIWEDADGDVIEVEEKLEPCGWLHRRPEIRTAIGNKTKERNGGDDGAENRDLRA